MFARQIKDIQFKIKEYRLKHEIEGSDEMDLVLAKDWLYDHKRCNDCTLEVFITHCFRE